MKLFKEIEVHLLRDSRPSVFFSEVADWKEFSEFPFQMLEQMRRTEQSPKYHPEGNVWIHTMMVVDEAAKRRNLSRNPRVFMWAALLHDIGKPVTTCVRHGKITSYNHDRKGEMLAREFLEYFSDDEVFVEEVCGLVRYHMQILSASKGNGLSELIDMKRRVDIREAALFGLCDRMGRTGVDVERERENVKGFLRLCGVDEKSFEGID